MFRYIYLSACQGCGRHRLLLPPLPLLPLSTSCYATACLQSLPRQKSLPQLRHHDLRDKPLSCWDDFSLGLFLRRFPCLVLLHVLGGTCLPILAEHGVPHLLQGAVHVPNHFFLLEHTPLGYFLWTWSVEVFRTSLSLVTSACRLSSSFAFSCNCSVSSATSFWTVSFYLASQRSREAN